MANETQFVKWRRLLLGLAGTNLLFLFILGTSLLSLRVLNNYHWLYQSIFRQTRQILENKVENMVLGETTGVEYADGRVFALEQFLAKYESPLYPYAEKIVAVSDEHGFHYGLLPAIAMVESGLCKKIPENSNNCWGWGIYGKTVTRFVSYDEAIETVAKGIKRDYIDKGFDTPEKIMSKYNPTNHNDWLGGVNFFLKKLE